MSKRNVSDRFYTSKIVWRLYIKLYPRPSYITFPPIYLFYPFQQLDPLVIEFDSDICLGNTLDHLLTEIRKYLIEELLSELSTPFKVVMFQ
jgi:hypothetical protein